MQSFVEKTLDRIAIIGCAMYILAIIALIVGGICAGLTRIFVSDYFVWLLCIAGGSVSMAGGSLLILGLMGWLQFCEYDKQKK